MDLLTSRPPPPTGNDQRRSQIHVLREGDNRDTRVTQSGQETPPLRDQISGLEEPLGTIMRYVENLAEEIVLLK